MQKNRPLLIALLMALIGISPHWGRAQDTLSLQECLIYTLEHNENSSIYKNNALMADEKIREYRAKLLPTVSGSANLDYNPKLQVTVIPAGVFGDTQTELTMGNKFVFGGTVDAEQVLLNRAYLMDIRAAKIDKQIADLKVRKENEELLYNTATAFYEALATMEELKLLRENERRNLEVERITRLNYEQGETLPKDYTRAQVNRKNIQSDVSQKDSEYRQALYKLKNAMGMNIFTPISVSGDEISAAEIRPDQLAGFTMESRLDYKIDRQTLEQKKFDLMSKRSAYLPTLSAYGTYGGNAYGNKFNDTFDRLFGYGLVGVKLSVPIFSGFDRSSKVRQSLIAIDNQKMTIRLNERDYLLNYQNSVTELHTSYRNIEEDEQTMLLAQEVLDATLLEYQNGETAYSTMLDDEFAYNEARVNYITSLIDFMKARLAMEKANGTLSTYLKLN